MLDKNYRTVHRNSIRQLLEKRIIAAIDKGDFKLLDQLKEERGYIK
jgi:hypothetical protein